MMRPDLFRILSRGTSLCAKPAMSAGLLPTLKYRPVNPPPPDLKTPLMLNRNFPQSLHAI